MLDHLPRRADRPALLHGERVVLCAPTQAWSDEDGTMAGGEAHGVYHGEWRWIRSIELLVDGHEVEHIATGDDGDWTAFHGIARHLDDVGPIAHVVVERAREASPEGFAERATLANGRDVPITGVLELVLEVALSPLADVRAGVAEAAPLELRHEGSSVIAHDGVRTMRVSVRGGTLLLDGHHIIATRREIVRPGDWAALSVDIAFDDPSRLADAAIESARVVDLPRTGRPVLDRWADRASVDLADLLLDAGHGPFLSAGAPWDLTLVAREALTASRLLLPTGHAFAEGTLRTVAALQGTRDEPWTGEEPGRMPDRMRRGHDGGVPSYDAVDTTSLWIGLLHDAWRAGMPIAVVREHEHALVEALGWLERRLADGFLTTDPTQPQQTWRETGDPWRFHDGTPAEGPIAAVELQGQAHHALVGGAALLQALGHDGSRLTHLAAVLRELFRAGFWTTRDGLLFPAMALDGAGEPIDVLCSSIGQLIGTGLLTVREERRVAALLLDDRLSSGFGLRSIAADAAAYWPLSPYGGSVHPHETALAIEGLLRRGQHGPARALAAQLERAAAAFDGRMPERIAGYGIEETAVPIPFPGASSPRAWSAAAAVPVHRALAGARAAARGAERPRLSEQTGPLPLLRTSHVPAGGGAGLAAAARRFLSPSPLPPSWT